MPGPHLLQNDTVETESSVVSEPASFKQREDELRSIEQRFGQNYHRRDSTLPAKSRFREEFDDLRAPAGARLSLFLKLRLPQMRREKNMVGFPRKAKSDGEIIKGSLIGEPEELVYEKCVAAEQSPSPFNEGWKPHLEESATGLWQRAIRTEAENRRLPQHEALSSRKHTHLHNSKTDRDATGLSKQTVANNIRENHVAEKVDEYDGQSHPNPREIISHPNLEPPVDAQRERTSASDISSRLLRTWSRQLSTPSQQFQPTPSIDLGHCGPHRPPTPPESWAKWPSHTRDARSGPAGEPDCVVPRDFATKNTSKTNEKVASMERAKTRSKGSLKSGSRTFSSSLGRAMKQSLAKMIPTKEGPPMLEDSRAKHKGFLEYPELELLPMQGGYKDLQALEGQINTMKHGTAPPEGNIRNLNIDSPNPSLGARLARDTHEIRYSKDDEHNRAIYNHLTISSPRRSHSITPGSVRSIMSNKLEATPSNVSYDDCVPKHMLDENDSIKSYKTVLVKRSKSHGAHTSEQDVANRPKYMTWHGHPQRQPVLLQSTLDFGTELDSMLASARDKAMKTSSAEDIQE